MNEAKYPLYDGICNAAVINIYSMAKRDGNKIISVKNPKSDVMGRLFFKFAFAAKSFSGFSVVIDMPLYKYIPYVIWNLGLKGFKYVKRAQCVYSIPYEEMFRYVAESFDSDITIFNEIYEEYYK